MSSVLDDFFACPSETLLESCTKKQLVKIAERFSIDLTTQDKRMKETLVTTLKRSLVDKGVFEVKPRKCILLSHWNRVIRCRIFFLEGGVTTLCSLSFPAGGRISWKRVVYCTPLLPDYIV
ncbi:uncharacterized protein [Misgurnus anguillicaudatus]|uniref:uncharacterized protein isoform X2 n=1 Tax=Misgurnus anguillicaudatus TaxID=75329 RepID=UPI003CCF413D